MRSLVGPLLRPILRAVDRYKLPDDAKKEVARDAQGLPTTDPGIDLVVREAIGWICRAQDNSPNHDGGVARHYSLIGGWGRSYPETTGYIVPTLLEYARRTGDEDVRARARRMLDWFLEIRFPDGGFQGGLIGAEPRVPVTFNTGQILMGLAAGVREFGDEYRPAMLKAADWLRDTQDADGCWRKHPTPFAAPGEKAYETHVAWGLLEAERVESGRGYGAAALANVAWAVTKQEPNGWLADCCLSHPMTPLTHTLGYALRGTVETFLYSRDERWLSAAERLARGLAGATDSGGRLPGQLDRYWRPAATWVCLTGSAQVAHSLLLLYRETGESLYFEKGRALNRYVRCTVRVEGPDEIRGGVKGSFPVDGAYGAFQYLNWAPKFLIDSCWTEEELVGAKHERELPEQTRRGSA